MFENILKTIYRTPIKSIIVLIILFFVSFALFSRINEYITTTSEFRALEDSFYGLGFVEISPPIFRPDAFDDGSYFLIGDEINYDHIDGTWEHTRYEPLTDNIIDFINNISYVTSTEIRFMTAGIHNSFFRLDEGRRFFNHFDRVIFEATLDYLYIYEDLFARNVDNFFKNFGWNEDFLPYIPVSARARFTNYIPLHNLPNHRMQTLFESEAGKLRDGGIVFDLAFRGEPPNWMSDEDREIVTKTRNAFGVATMDGMTIVVILSYFVDNTIIFEQGNRYILVGRFDAYSIELNCPTMAFWLDSLIIPIEDATDNADLALAIEMVESDWHTFDIVYTNDMSSIYRFAHGQTGISDGRMLTPDDYNTNHAVISRVLANEYNLSIGDTISFGLADRLHNQHVSLGALSAGSRGRFARPVEYVDLEIVGIFNELTGDMQISNNPNWAYSRNTIFVPVSLLPDSVDMTNHVIHPGEFSFIIGNIRDTGSFIETYGPTFRDMGIRLMFTDMGWSDIESDFLFTQRAAMIAMFMWILALIGVIVLVVYLFIIRNKKEYAIMRSIGKTKAQANISVFLPLFILGIISISLGGIIVAVNTQIILFIFITLVFLALVEFTGLIITGRKPVLELLQEGNKK